ncbi:MAG: ion channel [Candidatus Acidiferrales bacterium]
MTNGSSLPPTRFLRMEMSEFWAGDLGLTLVTLSLVVLIFVITPLREAGVPGRVFLDLVVLALMVSGAMVVKQGRMSRILVVAAVVASAVILASGRIHPTPFLHRFGSVMATITLILYVRIVLLVMFRGGRVTWSRLQGGVCAYLLLGMAWASAFQVIEQVHPGAFHFVSEPADMDQLTAKLTYFSFANLTTVGSDISPVNPFARSLTTAEAIVGQLYPAILIGALVAMAMQAATRSDGR